MSTIVAPSHVTGPTTGVDLSRPCSCPMEDGSRCPCVCHARARAPRRLIVSARRSGPPPVRQAHYVGPEPVPSWYDRLGVGLTVALVILLVLAIVGPELAR